MRKCTTATVESTLCSRGVDYLKQENCINYFRLFLYEDSHGLMSTDAFLHNVIENMAPLQGISLNKPIQNKVYGQNKTTKN